MRPIKSLTVDKINIDAKSDWEEIYKISEPAWYAYHLFMTGAYPAYLKREVESRYGKQDITINVSNHVSYQKEKLNNPEWFAV